MLYTKLISAAGRDSIPMRFGDRKVSQSPNLACLADKSSLLVTHPTSSLLADKSSLLVTTPRACWRTNQPVGIPHRACWRANQPVGTPHRVLADKSACWYPVPHKSYYPVGVIFSLNQARWFTNVTKTIISDMGVLHQTGL